MANTTNFQKAQILSVEDDIIRIKHPDLSGRVQTSLTASIAASGTTMTVADNSGLADNDWLVVGYQGDSQTEAVDINGAVTRGTSMTVTNSLKFAHKIDAPVTLTKETYIEVWGATTLTGTKTAVIEKTNSQVIQWDKPFTEYAVTGTQYAYYFVRFGDAQASPVVGEYSDGVLNTAAPGANSAEKMIANGLRLVGEHIDTDPEGLLTRDMLLEEVNNWQDDVTQRRDWSFEQ